MTITAKLLNENLKKGWDAQDFADLLGTTKEGFIAQLERTFVSRTLNGFRRRLKVNESQKKKRKSKQIQEVVVETTEVEKVIVDSDDSGDNDATVCESKHPSLYELEKMRESVSSQIRKSETEIVAMQTKRKAAYTELAAEEKWIDKFLYELNAHKKKAEAIVAAISSANEEIGQLKDHKKVLRDQLSQIEASIQATRKVTIYAVSQEDTVIESESDIPEYDTTYDTEIFNKIVASDLSESSTIKQIKYVASLIKYCHMLNFLNRTYEITFDSSGSEKLFFKFV